ncbi:hypothetical protein LWI28_018284 [Acer negundo]|uniref:Uncharacterized protein n=1 Tax=Acer negundo TaxID=4023 RepID=A0AAD5P122_ACENE|nr:hypothetical protein LWI28_018284 [Acer negundo]KAK4849711.1 hypothetical protein QYF36_000110 [Acer negundo]
MEENRQVSNKKYDCLLFDLDETLYPLGSGLSVEVIRNIQEYMIEKLGIEESKVPELCFQLYKYYGTTKAGLRAIGYNFDYDDFHSFVQGRLPYNFLKPDPLLRNLLLSLPIRKVIFTNADKTHAARVLNRLGIFDINDYKRHPDLELPKTPIVRKPFEEAYEQVFKIANINPQKTFFFDDSVRNLQTGKRMGLHTVLVGTSHKAEGVDYALESIHNIREALPELWESSDEKSESVTYSGKVAIETYVKALSE